MAKPLIPRALDASGASSTVDQDLVGKRRTQTTPDPERAGLLGDPNLVTGLVLYDTDAPTLFPSSVKSITIGSDPAHSTVVIASRVVSGRHCTLARKGSQLRGTDHSKNGTFVDGEREKQFYLRPGKTFTVGALPHRLLALNDAMRQSYPRLIDILGGESEHALGTARENPSPCDVIVAAVAGAPLLITSEPHCDQQDLARIIHRVSRCREREILERTADQIPRDRKGQDELVKRTAARSTLVLDLGRPDRPLDPAFVASLFRPRHQVRLIVLAHDLDIVDKAFGRVHGGKLQPIWLRPLVSRSAAIDRLFDRMLDEINSPLRMSHLTAANQDAVREYTWPANFDSLRKTATYLTAIYRLGSIHRAAGALAVSSSTLNNWYAHTLRFSIPLSNRVV